MEDIFPESLGQKCWRALYIAIYRNAIIAIGSCHLLWLGKIAKPKQAAGEEKLKGQGIGFQ